MIEVGIRELRDRLSRYLGRVRQGETITVTDRGRVVARIVPAGIPAEIEALLAEGRATWSGARLTAPQELVEVQGGSVAELVIEDRR